MKRIVIVGGGAGGLELATRLGRRRKAMNTEILLIDRNTSHFWKPRLHEIAAGLIGSDEDQTSYLAHGQTHGFAFQLGELTALDPQQRTIRIGSIRSRDRDELVLPEREFAFDILVLAFGSRVNDFGVPGVLEHCHLLDSAAQAAGFQRQFLEASVRASSGNLDCVRVGIVGAGATGVELAAELHHAAHAMQRFGNLKTAGKLQITLIDQASRVLAATDVRTSDHALASLRAMGVDVRLGQGVQSASAEALHLSNGESLPCTIKVWASGVTGHPFVKALAGLTIARGNRISVDGRLACVGVQGIFAIGDGAAAPSGIEGRVLPPTAQVAHQQAAYLAKALALQLQGKKIADFHFRSRGTLVSLGEHGAAAELPTPGRASSMVTMQGSISKLLYISLHHMHRSALHGWWRAAALFLADRLRRTTFPAVKLH